MIDQRSRVDNTLRVQACLAAAAFMLSIKPGMSQDEQWSLLASICAFNDMLIIQATIMLISILGGICPSPRR